MKISNALYQFTETLVADAPSEAAISFARLHLDIYENFEDADRWIRFSGMRGGRLLPENGEITKQSAVHYVYFVAEPKSSAAADRFEASELTERMAMEWAAAVFDDRSLGDRICDGIGEIIQIDDWMTPQSTKMPVTILQVTINPA